MAIVPLPVVLSLPVLSRLFVLLLALGAAVAAWAEAGTAPWQGVVTRVTDGDSLWVRPESGGRSRRVRISGIDAPELCQVYGQEARAALARQVKGRELTLEVLRLDDYGRPLVRLALDGDDVARRMVLQGHAWSYRYRQDPGPYAQEEAEAREARRGLFAAPEPERPYDFRKRHGPCTWR